MLCSGTFCHFELFRISGALFCACCLETEHELLVCRWDIHVFWPSNNSCLYVVPASSAFSYGLGRIPASILRT